MLDRSQGGRFDGLGWHRLAAVVDTPSTRPRDLEGQDTLLACEAWSAFPGGWGARGRSLDRMEAEAEGRIAAAVRRSREDDELLRRLDPDWLDFLRTHMPVAAFAFQSAGRVLQGAGERCRSRALGTDLLLQGSMLLRQAQAIVLYAADMEAEFGLMPVESARVRWTSDPEWRTTHRLLRRLATAEDWGLRLIGINLCFEPLLGDLLRREVATELAAPHGDRVTSVVAQAGQAEWDVMRDWTVALLTFLLSAPGSAQANRAVLRGWLAELLPEARSASVALAQITRGLPHADGDPDAVVARVQARQDQLLESVGLA